MCGNCSPSSRHTSGMGFTLLHITTPWSHWGNGLVNMRLLLHFIPCGLCDTASQCSANILFNIYRGPQSKSSCNHCLRLYNTKLLPSVVTGRQLEVLVLLYGSSSKLLIKWQGPFEVKWQAREVKYEVMQMDSGNLMQIYHVNHPSRAHW